VLIASAASRIEQPRAHLQRQATAPYAPCQTVPQPRQPLDPLVAAVGIAANLSGLAAGISIAAAKAAAFWVFAAFVPMLILALICAWTFTREVQGPPH
jgi:hypothetical protein